MAQLALDSILNLARHLNEQQQQFAAFCVALRRVLARAWLPGPAGQPLPLAHYLELRGQDPRAAGAGDEAAVVDVLVREVLTALGFGPEHISHNRALALAERTVPDFAVQLPELGPAPVLIVEDKSTAVRDFYARRRGAGLEESPLEQLRRYVRSGAVRGRAGLLCNGWVLEGWEFAADGPICLLRVNLQELAALSLEAPDRFPGSQQTALHTLWSRCSRTAFVEAHRLGQAAFMPATLPQPVVDRLQEALNSGNPVAAFEQVVLEHHEAVWREQALDVAQAPEQLVEALRGLIEQFAGDVEHQLTDALQRFASHQALLREAEQRADLPRLRRPVEEHRHAFRLPPEEFRGLFLDAVEEYCRHPVATNLAQLVRDWLGSVAPHVKLAAATEGVQLGGLEQVSADPPTAERAGGTGVGQGAAVTNRDGHARRVLERLGQATEVLCRAALELHLRREELAADFARVLRTEAAYQVWVKRVSASVMIGAPPERLRAEFARQTAYVYLIRLLLVRICEDKGLFARKLSDGGLLLWQDRMERYLDYAAGRSYDYLTRMAFECAQNIYVHFYGAAAPFDWYQLDEKMLARALAVLNAFNLEHIDTDVIGAVYGRYLREGKHEQGRYYTPPPLVRTMLDAAGWQGRGLAGRRLADLACGSGSFLVEACRRLLATFRDSAGTLPAASIPAALAEVQRSLYGLDLNPFACYLAETNLLIQLLDLVRGAQRQGLNLVIERFSVFCTDSLLVDEQLAAVDGGASLVLLGQAEAPAELLLARQGPFTAGCEVLVGNPPYVRADEGGSSWSRYRESLEAQRWFSTRHLKWDLYVPFVEQYRRLLGDGPEARATLVTIESLATAPYAARLRELLVRESTLHELIFARGLNLFPDAAWQNSLIFTLSRGAPRPGHRVVRRQATGVAEAGLILEPLDELEQATTPPEQLFSPRPPLRLDLADTVRWEELCYVSVGMVLNSDEKLVAGTIIQVPAGYDPQRTGEELVEELGPQGLRIRHRPFGRDELVADAPDAWHTRPTVSSREVLRGGIGRVRWLEYGAHTRVPARVRRPTFPELYERPKVMFGKFTGVAVDDGTAAGGAFLVVSDAVRVTVRWDRLQGVEPRAVQDARAALQAAGRYDPERSAGFAEEYLCGLALAAPLQQWLAHHCRAMKQDVYPDDIKALPIKRLSPARQQPFIERVRELHQVWRELDALEQAGFDLGPPVVLPVWPLVARFHETHPELPRLTLFQAQARGLFEVRPEWLDRDLRRARAVGTTIRVGREVAAQVGEAVTEHRAEVAALLAQLCAALHAPLVDRQEQDRIPATPAGLQALATWLTEQADAVRHRQARLATLQAELDELAWALYRPAGG